MFQVNFKAKWVSLEEWYYSSIVKPQFSPHRTHIEALESHEGGIHLTWSPHGTTKKLCDHYTTHMEAT